MVLRAKYAILKLTRTSDLTHFFLAISMTTSYLLALLSNVVDYTPSSIKALYASSAVNNSALSGITSSFVFEPNFISLPTRTTSHRCAKNTSQTIHTQMPLILWFLFLTPFSSFSSQPHGNPQVSNLSTTFLNNQHLYLEDHQHFVAANYLPKK